MKASEVNKGVTIITDKGEKTVRTSSLIASANLWRFGFSDGSVCLCPPDTDFQQVERD
jgi:hypothetical protein